MYKFIIPILTMCFSYLFGEAQPYLWQIGSTQQSIQLNDGNSVQAGLALSCAIATSGEVYITGFGGSGTTFPYLWIYKNGSTQAIELKDVSGTSFNTGGAYNCAIGTTSEVYIIGSGSLGSGSSGNQLPYLWIYKNGSTQAIELKDVNVTSFNTGLALSCAIATSGEVYITGNGDSGTTFPYLWIYKNGSTQAIELKDTDGYSYLPAFFSSNLAIGTSGEVYIGSSTEEKNPYLWIYKNGFIEAIELKNVNGESFMAFGSSSCVMGTSGEVYIGCPVNPEGATYLWIYKNGSIQTIELNFIQGYAVDFAIAPSGNVYMVGTSRQDDDFSLPCLWIYNQGSTQAIELKDVNGNSFNSIFGSALRNIALKVSVGPNGEIYIIGSGFSGAEIPYLWIYNQGSIRAIELKNSNGNSFTTVGYALDFSTSNSLGPITSLVSTAKRFSNLVPLKGMLHTPASSVIYIVGGGE